MNQSAPVVYIFHGDDEFAIAQDISRLEAKLGDPSTAALNISRLDGRTSDLEEVFSLAFAAPFMAPRRMVVLDHPLALLNNPAIKEKFVEYTERLSVTTALVLVEDHFLTSMSDRRRGKFHWLEKWAEEAGGRVYLRTAILPKGANMSQWIQDRARNAGGSITYRAADLLASLVGDDNRLADQEIQKLLAYVNFQRDIDVEDVEKLTPDSGGGDIFALVDALGNRNGREAMGMLERLLEQRDTGSIFGMVIRQFRLLLLTREILDHGVGETEVSDQLSVPGFVARKLITQARKFSLSDLEAIYHQLLDLDESVKTGSAPADLALEMLVAELSADQPVS